MKRAEVWVIESLEDGVWRAVDSYIHLVDANNALHKLRNEADDPGTWRRKRYVRDTSTPCGEGRTR